jgi:hypothetical protein
MNEKTEKIRWADYLISAVRYESGTDNRIIAYLKVHSDEIKYVGEGRTWSKAELLDALKGGKSMVTIKKDKEGKWSKCQNVSLGIFSEVSIRSDLKKIPGDYLENVSEF